MINGAHVILYSRASDADRAFLKDVLGLTHVDVGGGWLIFGLPPSEVAVHPAEEDSHSLYLMCDDVEAFVANMAERGIATSAIQNQGWGMLTNVTLPGGAELGVYQPRHARPKPSPSRSAKAITKPRAKAKAKPAAKKAKAKPAAKSSAKAKAKPKRR